MSEERQAQDAAALHRAYRAIFEDHPAGRMVLADLLAKAGLLYACHVPNDPCSTAWNDGKRCMGLLILQELRWTEAELLHLAKQREPEWDPIGPEASRSFEQADDSETVVF